MSEIHPLQFSSNRHIVCVAVVVVAAAVAVVGGRRAEIVFSVIRFPEDHLNATNTNLTVRPPRSVAYPNSHSAPLAGWLVTSYIR